MINDNTNHSLTALFEILKGGSLVALSRRQGGGDVMHLIVENHDRLGGIPDSWGRVILTLSGCRRCHFRPIDGMGSCPDWERIVAQVRPALRGVSFTGGACVVECSYGLMYGTLEIIAEGCSLMMGSGRTLDIDEFFEELQAHEEDPGYARAS